MEVAKFPNVLIIAKKQLIIEIIKIISFQMSVNLTSFFLFFFRIKFEHSNHKEIKTTKIEETLSELCM